MHHWTVRSPAQVAWALALVALVSLPALAQTTVNEWSPEIDTYVTLTSRLRASLFATRTRDAESTNSFEVGPNLDITFRSLRGRKTPARDVWREKLLTLRLGYHYIHNVDSAPEQRGILELTPRFYLPKDVRVMDRNRVDLRSIAGDFSWRYRNRISLERDFEAGPVALTPYLRWEIFYDSRYATWNRKAYIAGIVFPIGKHVELEPSYERHNDSRSSTHHENVIGCTLSFYLAPFQGR